MTDEQIALSKKLYDLGSLLTYIDKPDDGLIERFCVLAGIPYPPEHH